MWFEWGEKGSGKIAQKEVAAEDTVEKDKKKVDNAKATEMRNRALVSLGKTQKRQRHEEEEKAKPKQQSRRSNISNTRDSVSSGYPNTEKRVENATHCGVFLTKFEVFKLKSKRKK